MTIESLALVPSWRLGTLLRQAREAADRSLEDLAARSGAYDAADLRAVEDGERALDEAGLAEIVALYGIPEDSLLPGRTDLVVDLDHHHLATAGHTQPLAGTAPTADEVLSSYLSLVYTLRRTEPGAKVPLRQADLDVLARALALATPDVEHRLVDLMATPTPLVREQARYLRTRVLVPAAGVLLALTVAGAIVVSARSDDRSSAPPPAATPPAAVADTSVQVGDTSVQIGGAATQIRNPDGTPGPVVVTGEGDVTDLPPGAVATGDPQVATRNPDGSVTQTSR